VSKKLIGVPLPDLPLKEAQRYIRGFVWKHLHTEGYVKEGKHSSKAYWLSAHLCAKFFALIHYVDDTPRIEPAEAFTQDLKDWVRDIGFSEGYTGAETKRLVSSGFIQAVPELGKRPIHFILGPAFPEEVVDESLFKKGDAALQAFDKKTKSKLKKIKGTKKVLKSTLPLDKMKEATTTFSDGLFEALKQDIALYDVAGGWLKLVAEINKQDFTEKTLDELLQTAHIELKTTLEKTESSSLLLGIFSFLSELHTTKTVFTNKQQVIQLAKSFKEEKCLQQ